MLNKLIRFSLAQRALILMVAILLLALGLRTARELPVDVLPDLTRPTVTILTEAPGYAPEEVEKLITVPMENALMGVAGVTRLRSVNDIGLSLIFVEFDWGIDIYQARQFVQERLYGISESIPEGINPYMTPVASLMGNIALVGLVDPSGAIDPQELRVLADWNIGRKLQAIPGVAEVLSMGGGVRQLQVQPQPEQMLAHGVTFDDIREAAANAVKNTTGGFLTEAPQEIMVRNLAMTTDLKAIANTVVSHLGERAIRIGDVADVTWDVAPMRGDAGLGSHLLDPEQGPPASYPGIILSVTKSPGFDTIELNSRLETALKSLQETLPGDARLITLYRQSDYIDLAIGNLEDALRDGAIMVSLILFLFLLNLRVTFMTLTAIPLSLAITILVFDLAGLSVNSMTLGGLAVAIGMVVDDAIVDVENVFRRLRENAGSPQPLPRLEVIARASAEVRSSILYATVLIILVFVPLMALSGIEGRLFAPIAIATMVSMAASFVVSLTVIPVLCSFLLRPKSGKAAQENVVVRLLQRVFTATWLRFSLSQPLLLLALTIGLFAAAVFSASKMGGSFLPAFREPTLVVATTTAPGTSLKQTNGIAHTAVERLLAIEGIETVGFRVGRAEKGDHVVPVSTVEFDVEFAAHTTRPREPMIAEVRATMAQIPGTFSAMSGPLADRVGHMLSGVSAKVAVKVFGPDLEELRAIGSEIVEIARDIPGLEEARGEQQASIPQLRIEVNRERALAYGITPGRLNEQLAMLMGGEAVAEVYEGDRVYDLVVRLPLEWRENANRLTNVYFENLTGQQIPLSYVADIRQASGPNNILRENTLRRFVVSINPTIPDLNSAVEALKRMVEQQIQLPEGYFIQFEGEYQAQQEARTTILFSSLALLLVISVLLYSYFRSAGLVLIVLSNIPISLIGGVYYTGMTLNNISIATIVGFIAIAGIAARNSIMMLSRYLHMMRNEGYSFSLEMVQRGTSERLIPVLMTALSAGIALIPMVIAADAPGKEILNPVSIVIVGGLVSSTLLGLAITPALFFHFCRRGAIHSVNAQSAASE